MYSISIFGKRLKHQTPVCFYADIPTPQMQCFYADSSWAKSGLKVTKRAMKKSAYMMHVGSSFEKNRMTSCLSWREVAQPASEVFVRS